MTEGQYSAEKDLLKLIENPGEIESQKPKLVNVKASGKTFLKKLSVFSFLKHSKQVSPKTPFDLKSMLTDRKQILKLLFVITLCVFVFFIVTIFREYTRIKNMKNLVKFTYVSQGKEAHTAETASDAKSLLDNGPEPDLTNPRNIFKAGPAKKEEEKKDDVTVALNDYRLVGISLEPDPKETYAMVKNIKTNITFFMKKGENLNGIEILNILDNKLILKVKGREVEFR